MLEQNPELNIGLIPDGSHLDDKSLAEVAAMVEKAGGQVWVERVGTGKEVTVIIEDGEVVNEKELTDNG